MAETHPMVPGFIRPPPPKPTVPDPKPLHNELWSIRSLAVETLNDLGTAPQVTIEAQKARLLLEALISLIDGPKKAQHQDQAQQGLLTAMSGRVQAARDAAEAEGE